MIFHPRALYRRADEQGDVEEAIVIYRRSIHRMKYVSDDPSIAIIGEYANLLVIDLWLGRLEINWVSEA